MIPQDVCIDEPLDGSRPVRKGYAKITWLLLSVLFSLLLVLCLIHQKSNFSDLATHASASLSVASQLDALQPTTHDSADPTGADELNALVRDNFSLSDAVT